MDEITKYNEARWKALADADALFTRPNFDLDERSAKELVDPSDRFGQIEGKKVLCLAGGGGQQSAAFSFLGASVTVFDLSPQQLERDRVIAEYYDFKIETIQGDMRDLSVFEPDSFDLVYHPYSLNFVPNATQVFAEVARILKPRGVYQFSFANPFIMSIRQEEEEEEGWNGAGYLLSEPYVSDAEITYPDQAWVYDREAHQPIPPPREYKHRLGDLFGGLIGCDFVIRHVSDNEDMFPDPDAKPGSWDHFVAFAPPWLSILAVYRPDLKF